MSKQIIASKGLFSSLTISLNDEVMDKLITIDPKDNPLKTVEADLANVLKKFERAYFDAVNEPESAPTPLQETEDE